MKKRISALALTVLMLALTGCGAVKEKGEINGYQYEIGSEVSYSKLKDTSGYYVVENEENPGWISYVILMGEMGAGDKIEITDLKMDGNGNLEIVVKRKYSRASEGPAVLTYPYCYLNISSAPNSVKVMDTEGWEYRFFEEETTALYHP